MNVYIFMGTHLPEMRACLSTLAASIPEEAQWRIFHPKAVSWPGNGEDSAEIEAYDPEDVQWVLNPDANAYVFIVTDPYRPQIPQLEKLAEDLAKCLIEPVKVITSVDCERAETSPQLRAWLDACIYYSDIVFLGNRKEASKAFVRDFQKSYEKKCYPCLFLLLKGPGKPDQPLEVLTPDTRRISQLFDIGGDEEIEIPGLVIESSFDLDMEEPEVDPFRNPDTESGQAPASIPDVSTWVVDEDN